MSASLNEIYEAIGALKVHVEASNGKIEALYASQEKTAERADSQRATMHRRIDDLVKDVSELKTNFEIVQSDVAESKAVTDDVTRWRQMGIGALGITGMAAGAISSLITYKWVAIVNWFMGR